MQRQDWSDMMRYIKKGAELSKSFYEPEIQIEEKHLIQKPKQGEEQPVDVQFCM